MDVKGPSNAPLLVPDAGGFAVRRFVENGEVVSDAESLVARALDDPLWAGTLVSADGAVGVVVVQPTDTRSATDARVVEAIEQALAPFEARGFRFYLAGDAISTVFSGRELAESSARLIPFTVLVIALVLLTLSRSLQSVAIALGTMGIALIWTFGLLGWLDWPQDGILEVLAPLILVVGVCDAIHLLSRYSTEAERCSGAPSPDDRSAVLLKVAEDVGSPCLITTFTTASAFLSFTTSALDTFVRFGVISAFGVVACLVLTFTLLPVLARALTLSGSGTQRASQSWKSALDAIVRTSDVRSVPILLTTAALFLIFCIGWFLALQVNTDWIESLGENSRAVRWSRFLEERLRPPSSLEIEITLPPESPIEDPETLRRLSEFCVFLSSVEELGSTTSILDAMGRLNRLLHDDDPAFERPGDTRAANAELIELIAFDSPAILASWLTLNRSVLRISVEASWTPHRTMKGVLESIRKYTQARFPRTWGVNLSGSEAINFDWVKDVQATQLRSFPTAFLLVFVMVAIFLRSIRLSVGAMIATLLPVVVTLGAMGWMGMGLDVGRTMIAAVLIGIAVDDSVHVLSQYKRRRVEGEDPREAIRAAILHTGRAVVTTSLALSLGFLTLMASAWQTISSFGFFVALAILGALAAVLFILPALIFAFERMSDT